MTTLLPTSPPPRFGLPVADPLWTVVRDGSPIGQVERHGEEGTGWHWWRANGQPHFAPTVTGCRCEAIQWLEWAAERPSGYPIRRRVPAELTITVLREEQRDPGMETDG